MLNILYQDDYLVVIDKPSGMLVHRAANSDKAKKFVLQELRNQLKNWVYPVHRLDQPTSGVLLFGLRKDAGKKMSMQFRQRQIKKYYLAIVRGIAKDYELLYEGFKKNEQDTKIYHAITEYVRLAQVELPIKVGQYPVAQYSLLKVKLHTGRIHQIRRHLKQIYHPIINDRKYGDWRHNKLMMKKYDIFNLQLLAHQIEFTHPYTEELISLQASLTPDMKSLFDLFGWEESLIEQMDGFGQVPIPGEIGEGFFREDLERDKTDEVQ